MAPLTVVKVDVELETPTEICSLVSRGVVHKAISNHIPPYTLRGAIITELMRRWCREKLGACLECGEAGRCIILSELTSPKTFFSAATFQCPSCSYPLLPTPITLVKCKMCKEADWVKWRRLINGEILIDMCPKCSLRTTLEPFEGFYCPECSKVYDIKMPMESITLTAIDKKVLKAARRMLYSYEVMPAKARLSAFICSLNEDFMNMLIEVKTLRIGRGFSRGLGRCIINVKEVKLEGLLKGSVEACEEMVADNVLVFVAKTPFLNISITKEGLASRPLPPEVSELRDTLIKIKSLQTPSQAQGLKASLAMKWAFGSITHVAGWGMKTEQPKPRLTAAKPGSVFIYKLQEKLSKEDVEAIALLELVGMDDLACLGFNIPYIYRWVEV